VPIDASLSIPESGVIVQMTPFLILVRKDGRVTDSWPGEMNARAQSRVLKMAAGG